MNDLPPTSDAFVVLRRLSILTTAWIVLLALLLSGAAAGQGSDGEDDTEEASAEPAQYGDRELIETLSVYGLLDEWVAVSPVSPQASLLLVTGNGAYQRQRQAFLDALDRWGDQTETVRNNLAQINEAQANADRLRSAVTQVRDALVLDDRLAPDSKTLAEIEDALSQLGSVEVMPDPPITEFDDSLTEAEARLRDLWEMAEAELQGLNGAEPAVTVSGVAAFAGFERFQTGLSDVDRLIDTARRAIGPAQRESEQRAATVLDQIPSLHARRMLGSSDVAGLSVVTVDAYIRAAERSSCSVDWALLAGIGQVESNHGRLGGASVSRSGQVSTTILGPLLDGGATELGDVAESEAPTAIGESIEAVQLAVETVIRNAWHRTLDGSVPAAETPKNDLGRGERDLAEPGNGFAVVVDTDGGRLDGNERWDRAVGPMQFLPETWSKWATDGNGDGVTDPNNLYDAAASASRFLCDLSATLGPSPSRFILGYNASSTYVSNVLVAAEDFRSLSLPNG